MRTLRTPDERFADLPGFDLAPRYADVPDGDGGTLRMAWVEDGPGDDTAGPVLLLHDEPSWSYLYRTMIPVLAGAGLRAIAPDLVGFGRSDEPADAADHSYARHVEWVRALVFDALDLRGVTLVGQDWGGLIGLRLVAEHPDRFAAVVAADTGLPTGDHDMPEVWWRFRGAVEKADVLGDPITGAMSLILQRAMPGAAGRAHPTIAGAGHILAEDAGPALAAEVVAFVAEAR